MSHARAARQASEEKGVPGSAMAGRFDALITVDRSLRFQQSIAGRPVSVVVLRAPSNAIDDLRPLVPAIAAALATIQPGQVVEH